MIDLTELMGTVISASGADTDAASAIALVQKHVIDHATSTCACSPTSVIDPMEHLQQIVSFALNVPEPTEKKTPVQWHHRLRLMGGYADGPTNSIDRLLDLNYTNRQIAEVLFIPTRTVARRRSEWERFTQPEEAAA